jgi:hypothetical protein
MSVPLNLLRSRLFRRSAAALLLTVAVVACIGTKACDPTTARCAKATEITGSVTRPASGEASRRHLSPAQVAQAPAARRPSAPWRAGNAITVRRGDTVDDIARRHGVPAAAILDANQLPDRASVWVGQRLVVPL